MHLSVLSWGWKGATPQYYIHNQPTNKLTKCQTGMWLTFLIYQIVPNMQKEIMSFTICQSHGIPLPLFTVLTVEPWNARCALNHGMPSAYWTVGMFLPIEPWYASAESWYAPACWTMVCSMPLLNYNMPCQWKHGIVSAEPWYTLCPMEQWYVPCPLNHVAPVQLW